MRRILTVLALLGGLLIVSAAGASDGYSGTTYANGTQDGYYTYRDGYWWYGDRAFVRQLYNYPGYWSYGCYYAGRQEYKYTEVPVANKQVDYANPGWRTALLDIAKQRDKFEGEIRKSQTEQAQYLDAVKALGLTGNFGWDGYGAAPPTYSVQTGNGYSAYGNGYVTHGANASTQYGYSYDSVAKLYGDTDLGQLYQAANALAQNAQKLGGDATVGFSTLVGQEGANRSRVAEILAKGQAAQRVFSALQPDGQSVSSGYSFSVQPNQPPEVKAVPQEGNSEKKFGAPPPVGMTETERKHSNVAKLSAVVGAKCASCHSGAVKRGGLDMTQYLSFDQQRKEDVRERLTTRDMERMMPRNKDGSVGHRLSAEEQLLFFLN